MAKNNSVGILNYAWITLGGACAALLMAALLTQFLLFDQVKDTFVSVQATSQIDQLAAYFNQKQKQVQHQLESISGSPDLIQILRQGSVDNIEEQQRLTRLVPHALETRLTSTGKAVVDREAALPFSYASLDMVNRAEQGLQVYAEAIQVDNRWILTMVQPLRSSGIIIGTLFVYLDLDAMTSDFQLENGMGQISLKQQFGQNEPEILFNVGTAGADRAAISRNLDSPIWVVEHLPSDQVTNFGLIQPMTFWLPLIVFFPLSLGAALVSLGLIHSRLKAESLILSNQIRASFKGRHSPSAQLKLNEFVHIDAMLAKMQPEFVAAEEPDVRNITNRPMKTVRPVTHVDQEDMVDIEMLDDIDTQQNDADQPVDDVDSEEFSTIFRAYDIRGIINETLTPDSIYRIGKSIAVAILAEGENAVIVGSDGRVSSPAASESLIQAFLDSGLDVTNLGMVPTPVVYFATQSLGIGSAVMVTGSHNPPEYNGFKIMIANRTLAAEEIQQIHQNYIQGDFSEGDGQLSDANILNDYLDSICDDIVIAQPLSIVIDCGNGVAGTIAPDLFSNLGCEVTPLYCDVDGNFPNHDPDPTHPPNLEDLMLAVTSSSADMGIAFDGDGDRLVVITNGGNIIWPDRLLMLFAKDIVSRNPGSDVVYDIKCSKNLNAVVSNFGGRPIICKSGHSYLKAKMEETGALLGGEMSGHICFKERWNGFDDGLYAAARLLEIVGAQTKSIEELFDTFPKCASTAEIKIPIEEQYKFTFMEMLGQQADFGDGNINTLDGIRVDYADGWGLVRASNTSPNLTLRFEADEESGLQRIKTIFMEQLQNVDADLEVEF